MSGRDGKPLSRAVVHVSLAAENKAYRATLGRIVGVSAANHSLEELFDNMAEGIAVFGRDGRVNGTASRKAGVLFATRRGRRGRSWVRT